MTSPAGETTGFAGRLAQAIELAEDGDLEESEELFKTLFAGGGGTAEAALAYAKTLRKLGRLPEADALLTQAIAAAPENFPLRQAWSEIPRHEVNYAGTIARGRTLRKLFPPEHYPESWESFSVELDSLYEMGEWDQLENLVRQHWEDFLIHPEILPDAISALNKLFLHQDLARLVETAAPTAWTKLPPEAKANILNRTAAAARHHDAISHSGIKIISIGQNCLPYQLAGRWGFLGARADQAGLTPFDLGGFTNDSAAAAITTSFEIFARREDFKVTTAWGGGKMFLHQPTGIGFFHERGSHWVTPDGARFFTRLALMMTNWQLAQRAPRRLYVFSLCGAGELATLVHAAAEKLLDANAHLLILDVMQTPHQCPFHPQVTYRHLPYPKDYDWSSVFQQTSPAGFAFEQAVTSAISDALASLDPAAPGQAGDHALAREKIISKTWRFGPANGLALTETFRFGDAGQIQGYENDNEAYWTCDSGRLNIFKRSGEIMWTATAITQATPAQITLTTPHNENLKFFLTESNTTAAPSRRHLYTAKPRILILDNGLDIAARLPATLAHAQITRITSPDEIDAHESCNVFISSLVLSHARTRADAAAFISRATARFPLTIFIELSAHNAAYLNTFGLRSFHQGFAENTFMDQLSVEFCAQAFFS